MLQTHLSFGFVIYFYHGLHSIEAEIKNLSVHQQTIVIIRVTENKKKNKQTKNNLTILSHKKIDPIRTSNFFFNLFKNSETLKYFYITLRIHLSSSLISGIHLSNSRIEFHCTTLFFF